MTEPLEGHMRGFLNSKLGSILLLWGTIIFLSVVPGCATVSEQQPSHWLDPDTPANMDEMPPVQKIAYYIWWPILAAAKGFFDGR